MILNVTARDKTIEETVEEQVGKGYSFLQSIRLGGTGSPRLIITEAFREMAELLNVNGDINYCGLELRKGGIMLSIRCRTDTWAWLVPWHLLTIYSQNGITSVYRGTEVVKVKSAFEKDKTASFFARVLELKQQATGNSRLPGYEQ